MGFLLGFFQTGLAKPGEQGAVGVDPEVVLPLQMLVQPLQMGAVHVADPAAPLALEQKALPVAARVPVTVLVKGPLCRVDPMEAPGGCQFFSWR